MMKPIFLYFIFVFCLSSFVLSAHLFMMSIISYIHIQRLLHYHAELFDWEEDTIDFLDENDYFVILLLFVLLCVLGFCCISIMLMIVKHWQIHRQFVLDEHKKLV